ncbi:MAG: TlpA disulfide reductase family protein, partial [Candidatus Atribacteria bacterium]|nr:TlpA disulfide reductase family protein [Candidatus Atribacteria bacterium]
MYNKYKNDKKLVVLGIAEDAEATDMVKNLEIVFPMVVDEHYRVATLYGVKKLPHVIFIDKKGKVVRNVIETVLDEATIEKYLQEIF